MRALKPGAASALVLLSGCGLENWFGNFQHNADDRPASKIRGSIPWPGANVSQLQIIDGDGTTITPFLASVSNGAYELRLPSSKYSMLRVVGTIGNMQLRAIVPFVGVESEIDGVDMDALNTTETLIAEARLSADAANGATDANFKKVNVNAYNATRALVRDAFNQPGPAQSLKNMIEHFVAPVASNGRFDPSSGAATPEFFLVPELDASDKVTTSPLDPGALARNPFDYVGDGKIRGDSTAFDTALVQAAKMYSPTGCPDPAHIRVVFTVDFNVSDLKDGTCTSLTQFKWAVNKPGKTMFFVGWIDQDSGIQASDPDPQLAADTQAVANAMGNATPNTVPMFDDGTNGDEKAGDNIYTITFVTPRSQPGKPLRLGYKYTWGFAGAPWSGSEEWPGNNRWLEVIDDNGDNFVYRRDIWADEATNKNHSNSNPLSNGNITWTSDLTGCGTPETHENLFYAPVSCIPPNPHCPPLPTPKGIGPVKVSCQ